MTLKRRLNSQGEEGKEGGGNWKEKLKKASYFLEEKYKIVAIQQNFR